MSEQEMRELDAWIAEHVMEWSPGSTWFGCKEGVFALHPTDGVFIHDQGNHVKPFRPTTDPDAMAVLEKCAEKVGFRIAVQAVAGHWEVSRVCWENFTAHVTDIVEAETLPLAICLFAHKLFDK